MDNCFQPVSPAAWQNQPLTFSPGDKKKLSLFLADYWLTRREKLRRRRSHFAHFLAWRRQEGLAKEQQDRQILQEGDF
ncbi:hypothetical protein RJH75_001436 [Salmonella enterica]|uniref:hypothetical protein n=1 Tax=Salmonella enterica TaxID=28901 RepID=UPI000AE8E03C|nr:hypothetical protein [Salmonella enterica]ELG9726845.1 hypothetical protein [Salmonella enterica subsp. enterica serovar Rough O:z29]EEH6178308.1 hypothetical protein [Salmonella enterica]EEO4617151.1 hypothetical protein [Salmonella enterica]EFT1868415.1 hypothetical protein [Salmonella enterica subsp. enterica serovar Widemarsh]EGF6110742.1 hypothetical protein [Salmonella enterica]